MLCVQLVHAYRHLVLLFLLLKMVSSVMFVMLCNTLIQELFDVTSSAKRYWTTELTSASASQARPSLPRSKKQLEEKVRNVYIRVARYSPTDIQSHTVQKDDVPPSMHR